MVFSTLLSRMRCSLKSCLVSGRGVLVSAEKRMQGRQFHMTDPVRWVLVSI